MEKRALGLILTILGIAGLVIAAFTFINHSGNVYNIKVIATSCILGAIFFAAGIGLVRSTKDTLNSNERVS